MSLLTSRPEVDFEVPKGVAAVPHAVVNYQDRTPTAKEDELAVEEPLEIRLGGKSLAVTMRTPGHDDELVAGFLLSERVIEGRDDLDVIAHYTGPDDDPRIGNVINVVLKRPGPAIHQRLHRSFFTSSACGLCGKTSLDAIDVDLRPVTGDTKVSIDALYALGPALAAAQATFERTGGLHAAALFDTAGRLLVLREDVGRHNAVDKVVGHSSSPAAAAEPAHLDGQRPCELRDHAEGAHGADPDRGGDLGAVEPRGPVRAGQRHDPHRVPATTAAQRLRQRSPSQTGTVTDREDASCRR